jgi:hypothetical protein
VVKLRQGRDALGAGDGERTQPHCADMFNGGRQSHEQRLDMPRDQVNHGRPAAAIGHMGKGQPSILRK